MDLGFWLFIGGVTIIALGLWSKKRQGTTTRIDERGRPQDRLDAARKAAAKKKADGG